MLKYGAIEKTSNCAPQFTSTLFLRDKKDGGSRPIFNLKSFKFTLYQHFKLEEIPALIDTIQQGDYMYKMDLRNAYWSVPVLLKDKKWLKFQRKGITYQFRVWPLGLGPVPHWFTKLMKPVIRLLCRMGIRNVIYMDNLWGEEQGPHKKAALQAMITVKHLESLGFVINLEKSILEPTSTLTDYLGFILDSTNMTLALPPNKVKKVQSACQNLLAQERVTVREVARVLSQLVATSRAVFPAPLHYWNLQIT